MSKVQYSRVQCPGVKNGRPVAELGQRRKKGVLNSFSPKCQTFETGSRFLKVRPRVAALHLQPSPPRYTALLSLERGNEVVTVGENT